MIIGSVQIMENFLMDIRDSLWTIANNSSSIDCVNILITAATIIASILGSSYIANRQMKHERELSLKEMKSIKKEKITLDFINQMQQCQQIIKAIYNTSPGTGVDALQITILTNFKDREDENQSYINKLYSVIGDMKICYNGLEKLKITPWENSDQQKFLNKLFDFIEINISLFGSYLQTTSYHKKTDEETLKKWVREEEKNRDIIYNAFIKLSAETKNKIEKLKKEYYSL